MQIMILHEELGISDDQKAKIDAELDEMGERLRQYHHLQERARRGEDLGDLLERLKQLRIEVLKRIEAHLTVQQREKFHRLVPKLRHG